MVGIQLIGAEDVFSRGTGIGRLSPIFVEGIDHQVAFDLDRFLLAFFIEHQATTETASGSHALGIADRVDPDGDHPAWSPGFVLVFAKEGNGEGLVYIQLGTSMRQTGDCHQQEAPAAYCHCLKPVSHGNDFLATRLCQ